MRAYGALNPIDQIPLPPDHVNTMLIASSSGQAMDYPANAHIMRLTGITTAGGAMNFWVNQKTTGAAVPTSGATTTSSACQVPVIGQATFQVPAGSTGFSVAALTSGYVQASFWRK